MSYRDWGRGEGDPRARQPISSWDERAAAAPVDAYLPGERERTAGRRRSRAPEQEEPVDAYLPRWALESGVRRADGGGRHAAPDDEDDEPDRVASGGWRTTETTSSWHRVRETRWQEPPAITSGADSDHTGEWTFDRPQGRGYVGSRRADAADEEPVSGSFAERRPRRATTRRPQVTWSGGEEPSTGKPAERREAERDRPTRRARRAAEESWSRPEEPRSRPAADPWDRASRRDDPDPAYQPAVDPWDASGVHTWPASGEVDRWDASGVNALPTAGTADRWDASGVNALPAQGTADRWDAPRGGGAADRWDSTGQWEQPGVPGRWDQPDSTGQWERVAGAGPWDRTEPPRSRRADEEGWPAQDEGFWSGTRLAGDDPRWMDPSASAPRSPAVSYTAPRPRSAPGAYGSGRRPDPIGAPRGSGRPTVRRRVDVGTGPWQRRLEDDLLDPDPGGPFRPLLYTAACYLIPAVLIFAWLLTLDANPPAGCVTDITGGGCDSARAHALDSLVAGAPRFGLALVSSLVVAALLRRVGTTWRATTVALASAVVGGGLSTVMISAVTGQPIG
ncbi:hypothetical protein [Micromonospora costi]|uniref:Uncharacterized protein n=1 Tax=Micromonospora costi TaxID=1530042 RepID=A0A3A9ZT69_9ACTN|nr:hypothetical protein [Micromonospora costi]RKN51458.1 hypothetical protein D7193_29290 [Micromonospora costi]